MSLTEKNKKRKKSTSTEIYGAKSATPTEDIFQVFLKLTSEKANLHKEYALGLWTASEYKLRAGTVNSKLIHLLSQENVAFWEESTQVLSNLKKH